MTNSQNCGTIFHSNDNDYGENLHYCGHTSGYGCYSDEEAMKGLCESRGQIRQVLISFSRYFEADTVHSVRYYDLQDPLKQVDYICLVR